MLSFSEKNEKLNRRFIENPYFDTKSLQVPCNPQCHEFDLSISVKKRVLSFISVKKIAGSMTIEAALVLPLFLFFVLALLAPVQWLDTQRKVQMTTEYFCEKLSQYAYINEVWGEDASEDILGMDIEEFSGAASELLLKGKAEKFTDHAKIKTANVPDQNHDICFELEFVKEIPYFSSIVPEVTVCAAAKRRCWTGIDGKLKADIREENEDINDRIVYVGAAMGRYHLKRDCHYISNEYESTEVSEAKKRGLTPCSVCAKDCKDSDTVYITPNGEHYHKTKNCRSMAAYVREVRLSEVEYLGACSYCSGY